MRFPTTLSFSMVVASILAAGLGCGSSAMPDTDTQDDGAASASQRVESTVPAADLAIAVHGNTAFAFDLYREIAGEPGNLFFSPFSISASLAMTSAGARGSTERQMASALHFDLPQDRLHPAFAAITRAITAPPDPGAAVHLTLASSLWAQQGYPLTPSFLDTLAQSYQASPHVVDFIGDFEGARSAINCWMSQSTGQQIEDLLPPGSITSTTRLVLGDAVHFSAAWKVPFDPADTRSSPFTRRDGSTIDVPTMTGTQSLAYGEGPGYAALALPYAGSDLSMVLFSPQDGGLEAFEASLTPERLTSIVEGLELRTVAVTLPAFEIEASLALEEHLARLGMPAAFSDRADFSGISGQPDLSLGSVVHRTFLSVDETGTEAAAAAATGFTTTSAHLPAEIHFEHPYLFVVRDGVTGTVVFMGRVEDPSL